MRTKIFGLFLFLPVMMLSTSAEAQQIDTKAIDELFADWNQTNTPGCALGIFEDGELLYSKGYGFANLEYDIPISENSVFRIGSTSKQFTAACIVLLEEQGKLSFDDALKSFFPDFPDYAEDITVRQLLNHTSGIRDYLQLAYLKGYGEDDFYTDEHIMNWLIAQSTLNFAPGAEFLYSNSGYWLLGQIVNEVSGMNMADFAQQEIFTPLGMQNTHFHNDHNQIVKNRASGYLPNDGSYRISMTTLDMIGDGGIFTTIEDIKKWDDAFYNSSVLSSKFWSEMTRQGKLNNGESIPYASGLFIDEYKGIKSISHGGAFVGFRAELLRFPDEHLTIAIFANRGDANPTKKAYGIADILLSDKLKEPVMKKQNAEPIEESAPDYKLEQMTGDYEVNPGLTVTVSVDNDSLNILQNWDNSRYNLARKEGNTFILPGNEDLQFTFAELSEGMTQKMVVDQAGTRMQATRKEAIELTDIDLNEFTGSYYCEELGMTYNLTVHDEKLMLQLSDQPRRSECKPSAPDVFFTDLGTFNFQRESGSINGFTLDSGRVKNLQFERTL